MIPITNISGRLGNQMFQLATLYAISRDCNFPLVDNGLGYYFQDVKHFDKYVEDIKSLFSSGIPEKTSQVAIHVRRGGNPSNSKEVNYTDNPFYVDLSDTDYYRDAMALFPDADFLVFSDDIEWCKKQDIFSGMEFSENNDDITDLNLMASCEGHIIANSSYSWWGAFISPYTKKVVAPKNWYSDGIERTKCPETWIRL